MNDPWEWIANIVGTLCFIPVVICLFSGKVKVPVYLFVISAITFLSGLACAIICHLPTMYIIAISLICLGTPFLLWILCGGPCFAIKDEESDPKHNCTVQYY